MNLVLIAAIGENNELGKDNDLIWTFKDDLKFFKNQTMNHNIVMGYNTFKSLKKLLPGRRHIILTHKDKSMFNEEVVVVNSKDELLKEIGNIDDDVFIIGGASLYNMFINDASKLILTEIKDTKDASVYFPKFDKSLFDRELIDENICDGIKYEHVLYKRRNL